VAATGDARPAEAVVVMGVSGSGKTTIGRRVARKLGFDYADADDYHPDANIAKMRAGVPLDDDDRVPWLAALRHLIEARARGGRSLVIACSALKAGYRRVLDGTTDVAALMSGAGGATPRQPAATSGPAPRVTFVYLKGDYQTILARMQRRQGHYMKADMLRSQFRDLEEPQDAVTVDVTSSVSAAIRQALAGLAARGVGRAPATPQSDEEESA